MGFYAGRKTATNHSFNMDGFGWGRRQISIDRVMGLAIAIAL